MLFSGKTSVEDRIVEILLRQGALTGPDLQTYLQGRDLGITKQAMYVALKHLLMHEVVVRAKSYYMVSASWKAQLLDTLISTQWQTEILPFGLAPGEHISYRFPSFLLADRFWAHALFTLTAWAEKSRSSIYIYNPHNWFYLVRENTEQQFISRCQSVHIPTRCVIWGNAPWDLGFARTCRAKNIEVAIGQPLHGSEYYLNIFWSYLIEVFITSRLASKIDELYQIDDNRELLVTSLTTLLATAHPVRLKISNHPTRAQKLRKSMEDLF